VARQGPAPPTPDNPWSSRRILFLNFGKLTFAISALPDNHHQHHFRPLNKPARQDQFTTLFFFTTFN
jgi:hypothetical protein